MFSEIVIGVVAFVIGGVLGYVFRLSIAKSVVTVARPKATVVDMSSERKGVQGKGVVVDMYDPLSAIDLGDEAK